MISYKGYDCYFGILTRSSLLAALSSKKMTTALGQLVLATQVKKLGIPACVYNLDVTDWLVAKQDITLKLGSCKKPLVGFTLVAGNVDDSLKLAKWFKSKGVDVILGGPEITTETIEYYNKFSFVDQVIFGNAQDLIPGIMTDGLDFISNFCINKKTEFDFGNISVDYGLLFRMKEDHEGVSYIWGGDCPLWNKRCFFCARQKRGFGFCDPKVVWSGLKTPFHLGISRFSNTADTVAVFPDKFAELLRLRPTELSQTIHKTFINADQVNHEIAELLAEFNALAAVGIESFGNLKGAGKGNTTDYDNLRAIEILAEHKVKMILTFVLGLPGETEKSLKRNLEILPQIVSEYSDFIYMVTVSPLLVTIGSRAFDETISRSGHSLTIENFGQMAYYNPLQLSELYYNYFCQVGRLEIIQCIKKIYQAIKSQHPLIEFDSKGIKLSEKEWIES